MFVDYGYYTDSFAGSLVPAEEFAPLEREAERLLGYITNKRYFEVSDAATVKVIKNSLCSAIEEAYEIDQQYANIPAGVTSETTDGHSVTFAKVDQASMVQQRKKIMYDVFAQDLFDTGLLYQGVYP